MTAAIDTVFDVSENLRTGRRCFLGAGVAAPGVDTVRAADAFLSLVTGLILGVDSIGVDDCTCATRESSAAIRQHAILTDKDLADLGRRLHQAERAGEALATGDGGHPPVASLPIGQVPFDLIRQVRSVVHHGRDRRHRRHGERGKPGNAELIRPA